MDPVAQQRSTLCDLLESLSPAQWDAETMCAGWDAADMCAHLLVREREPWASAGLIIPPLEWLHEKRMASRRTIGRQQLVEQLRSGPPTLATKGIIGRVQVGEDYIHTEDIRRGGAVNASAEGGSADLTPDDGASDVDIRSILWQAVSRFVIQTFGGVHTEGSIVMTDGQTTRGWTLGSRLVRRAEDPAADTTVTVTAPVGELLLFTTGRSEARVVVEGPEPMVQALQASGRRV